MIRRNAFYFIVVDLSEIIFRVKQHIVFFICRFVFVNVNNIGNAIALFKLICFFFDVINRIVEGEIAFNSVLGNVVENIAKASFPHKFKAFRSDGLVVKSAVFAAPRID